MLAEITKADQNITILGLILGILVAIIILAIIILKSKRNINVKGSVKHGNSEASVTIANNNNNTTIEKEIKNDAVKEKQLKNGIKFDLEKLTSHRFFTMVLVQNTTDNCIFNLYNETLRIGVIRDSDEIANFKKIIASKYLNLCLFKVLGEHIKKWITDLVNEVSASNTHDKVPANFFVISQYITQYKNDAYKEGKSIEFKYNGKLFYGIPTQFMHRFNDWSDVNMNRVYNMISDALYSTQDSWFAKTIELLDLFEIIFLILHEQMDATLIILNGEISNFLKKIKEEKFYEGN
jgi:hypothetical protein